MKSTRFFLFWAATATVALGNPKKYVADEGLVHLFFFNINIVMLIRQLDIIARYIFRGFEPSNRYYESSLPDYRFKTIHNETKPDKKDNKESRFGIIPISTGYGSNGISNGMQYGTNGVMISPMKIDLGGVALGALLGLGAILIVPKLAHVLSGGLGGYRSK